MPQTLTFAPTPLHGCFEDAGVLGALLRLLRGLCADFPAAAAAGLAPGVLPGWVQSPRLEDAAARCDTGVALVNATSAMELVRAQRRMRQLLESEAAGAAPDAEPAQSVALPDMDPCRVAVVVRLCHGEMLEAYARCRALRLCGVREVPLGSAEQAEFARLCHDAALVAVWTSAHAEYLVTFDELTERHPGAQPPTAVELQVPPPELHTVPCAANGVDLTALYERAGAPRACPKGAQGLLAVLTRVTARTTDGLA